jgi:hypothetical protein
VIDGGILIIVIGTLIMFVPPAHGLVAKRRYSRTDPIGALLQDAFLVPNPDQALGMLIEQAEAAIGGKGSQE